MASSVPITEISNVSGAIFFVAYVFAALLLTSFLIYSLRNAYNSLDAVYKKVVFAKLRALTIASCVSFCVLSYNMLSYLIISYQAWATVGAIPLPAQFNDLINSINYTDREPRLHIWKWLKTSTLFRDFALTICKSNGAYFWTGQALVTTLASSIFLAVEGRKLGIAHLWVYALIGQILPVSFAMNLFFIAILVCYPVSSSSGWLVDFKGSIHLTSDTRRTEDDENIPLPSISENKEKPLVAHSEYKIACRAANGTTDLVLQDVVQHLGLYPGVISAQRLSSAGYSWHRTLKGVEFQKENTKITASMHPAGLYFLDTAGPPTHDDTTRTRTPFSQLVFPGTILFALAVHSAPLFADAQSSIFIPIVLSIRLLIFLPLLLAYATPASAFLGSQYWPSRAQQAAQRSYLVLLGSVLFEATRLASFVRLQKWHSFRVVLQTINDDPSISALGNDLLLAWLSVLVWFMEDFTVAGAVAAGFRVVLQVIQVLQDCTVGRGSL